MANDFIELHRTIKSAKATTRIRIVDFAGRCLRPLLRLFYELLCWIAQRDSFLDFLWYIPFSADAKAKKNLLSANDDFKTEMPKIK